ncbi:MAG: hypothetical protein JXQ99_00770 [Hyphomicrobiaceae bacterium]
MATAVVFVGDRDFLLPTIGAAISARKHISDPEVQVVVFVTDLSQDELQPYGEALCFYDVKIRSTPIPGLAQVDRETYNVTHVPISALSRLWLDDYLAPDIDRFLYLDGDVDITGSLDDLLAADIPVGGFLAAPDLPLLIEPDIGRFAREAREYLAQIGVTNARSYFNSGVLLVDRSGWGMVSSAARDYITKHPRSCRYHDQSALNAVAGSLRGELSLCWNYQTAFMMVGDPRSWGSEAKIWHFTGFPKPWHSTAFPWSSEFGSSYRLAANELALPSKWSSAIDEEAVANNKRGRQLLSLKLNWVYPWRRWRRARIIKAQLLEHETISLAQRKLISSDHARPLRVG